MKFLREMQERVEASDDGRVSLIDPDARPMATSGRGTGIVGYNVQIAVDPEHHLVVVHDVVKEGHDRTQLVPEDGKARQAIGAEEVVVLADRGYHNGDEVLACEGTGILPAMPRADTSGRAKKGLFMRAGFVYDAAADHYVCPAGAALTKYVARSGRHGNIDHYRNLEACHALQGASEKVQHFKRWKHEAVLEAMQRRLDATPDAMAVRRATVEHVFGTMKAWMGSTPFLTKGQKGVRTEMSLAILAYNMKQMIRLLGAAWLIQAIRAWSGLPPRPLSRPADRRWQRRSMRLDTARLKTVTTAGVAVARKADLSSGPHQWGELAGSGTNSSGDGRSKRALN